MRNKILITTQMMIHDQDRFGTWLKKLGYDVDFKINSQFLTEEECLLINPEYTGWISGDDEITSRVLDHFSPKLRIISKWGTGLDSIDLAYAKKRKIAIKNSPGAFGVAVGELAVGYLLALVRGIVNTHQEVLSGNWPKRQFNTLAGMRVGIVGMGVIGQETAKRLEGFKCEIYYTDPKVDTIEYNKTDIFELFKICDCVILTCNLNASTFHLVNQNLLENSKKGILIINMSRGSIIDESALIYSLENGSVAGAALDVYETEPLSSDSKLMKFENMILGSHNANNVSSAVEYVHENTINQLNKYLTYSN